MVTVRFSFRRLAASPWHQLLETCCVSLRPSVGDLLRFLETISWRLAAFQTVRLSETCCLSVRPSIGYMLLFRQIRFRRLAAFSSDHLLDTCCVSVRPSIGDLLLFRQTIYWILAAFPSDCLSETCCLSVRPSIGDLLPFRQTSCRSLVMPLLDYSRGDILSPHSHRYLCCLDQITSTEVCSVLIRSEFRRLASSLSAASRRLALSDEDRLKVKGWFLAQSWSSWQAEFIFSIGMCFIACG